MKHIHAPSTRNLEAAGLVELAKYKCDGCRLSWRLDGWRHREPMPIECTAKTERKRLREIGQGTTKLT